MLKRGLLHSFVIASTFLLLVMPPARADVIELRADIWCPLNCEPDSDRPGYMIELAQEALALYGHEVRYSTMTWGRSLEWVRRGEINGVIGTDQDESPDLVFGPVLGAYQETLIFRKDEGRQIETAEDLDGIRIGAVVDYDYHPVFNTYITEHQQDPTRVQMIGGDETLKRNLQKLSAGRIDMAMDERSVVHYMLRELGMRDRVDLISYEEPTDLFIAFSPVLESSQLYARQLSEGLAQLKESGRYTEILSRYGLSG